MDDKLRAIRQAAHERVLSARTIERIVESKEFEDYLRRSLSSGRLAAEQLITSGNKDGLDAWMAACRNEFDFAALSIRELRQLGAKLGIPNFNRMSKAQLLSEIENATQDDRKASHPIDPKPQATTDRCRAGGECDHSVCQCNPREDRRADY